MDLRTYLQQAFQPAEPHDRWAADLGRKLAKWFFDFTRNIMILGVIKYVADQTTSTILDVFYLTALGMMFLYTYTFTNIALQVRPFEFLGNNMLSRILDHLFNFGLGVATVSDCHRCDPRRNQRDSEGSRLVKSRGAPRGAPFPLLGC